MGIDEWMDKRIHGRRHRCKTYKQRGYIKVETVYTVYITLPPNSVLFLLSFIHPA